MSAGDREVYKAGFLAILVVRTAKIKYMDGTVKCGVG
jgi:hypothetical protein